MQHEFRVWNKVYNKFEIPWEFGIIGNIYENPELVESKND